METENHKRDRRKKLVHVLSAFIIALHAFEKWEIGHDLWIFFGIAAVAVFTVVVLHHKLERRFPWIDVVFFAIEAVLSLLIAYDFFRADKKFLPWFYVLAAFGQVLAAFIKTKRSKRQPY